MQIGSMRYSIGERTARVSAVALHLNSKQLISLDKAVVQLQQASSASTAGDAHTGSPGVPSGVEQLHTGDSQSADSPSSSIFDAFASSPMRSRHGAVSPIKSPTRVGARGPVAAQPSSPAQFAGSPVRLPVSSEAPDKPLLAHSAAELPSQTARRRPTLSPLVLDAESPPQPAVGAASLPGVFIPRVSPAASGERRIHMRSEWTLLIREAVCPYFACKAARHLHGTSDIVIGRRIHPLWPDNAALLCSCVLVAFVMLSVPACGHTFGCFLSAPRPCPCSR